MKNLKCCEQCKLFKKINRNKLNSNGKKLIKTKIDFYCLKKEDENIIASNHNNVLKLRSDFEVPKECPFYLEMVLENNL